MLTKRVVLSLVLAIGSVTAAYAQSCSAGMSNIAFGNVDVTSGNPVDTGGTLQVTCSGFVGTGSGRLCISFGVGSSGDATSRQLLGPSSVRYDLYTTAARTTLWGSWQSGYKSPGLQVDVANGTKSIPVYARFLGSQQSAPSGSYSSSFAGRSVHRIS